MWTKLLFKRFVVCSLGHKCNHMMALSFQFCSHFKVGGFALFFFRENSIMGLHLNLFTKLESRYLKSR